MLLRRIEGKTLDQALDRVRAECGEHALLVETRATGNGYLVVAARPDAAVPPPRHQAGAIPPPKWTRGFQPLALRAALFGLSERLLRAVEDSLAGTRVNLQRPGDPALPALAQRVLQALLRVDVRIEQARDHLRIAVVGPTGVGKTTTLAKLAARAVTAGQDVAIVTVDTYRVAAVEQLRAFADLLDVPCEVAFTPQELRRALLRHGARDRVFVDTTGRSPLDRSAMQALAGTLGNKSVLTLLCLAANTRRRDCEMMLDRYDLLGIDAVALTKWDETAMPGETLSALIERGLPLSHVTIGQEVPADIVTADAAELAAAALAPAGGTVEASA
ncbi:MAG TPA: AAA family ATPase [Planctomycetota bacterium]|nr:AAA family ATPase [Planctomycetota bacterium]